MNEDQAVPVLDRYVQDVQAVLPPGTRLEFDDGPRVNCDEPGTSRPSGAITVNRTYRVLTTDNQAVLTALFNDWRAKGWRIDDRRDATEYNTKNGITSAVPFMWAWAPDQFALNVQTNRRGDMWFGVTSPCVQATRELPPLGG